MNKCPRFGLLLIAGLILTNFSVSIPTSAATAPEIDEFPTSFIGNGPTGIALGPDGAMWFAETGFHVGRITTGSSPILTEYGIFPVNGFPFDIAAGPDGAMWFTIYTPDAIGRITTDSSHTITSFPTPESGTPSAFAQGIAMGPDGAMWFAEESDNRIGRITTDGSHMISEYPTTTYAEPLHIAAGPDGAMWFTDFFGIGRINTGASPVAVQFDTPTSNAGPSYIALGPDGAMWFTEQRANQIARISTDGTGTITEYPVPTANAGLQGIALGPDGAIWFAERVANQIGRISTDASHTVTEYAVPTAQSGPVGIATGPNSTLWFTEQNVGKIGRIMVPTARLSVTTAGTGTGTVATSPSGIACGATCSAVFGELTPVTLTATPAAGMTFVGWSGGGCVGIGSCILTLSQDTIVIANFVADTSSDILLVSSLLPTSRSVVVGSSATFFATMGNASTDTAGTDCTVAPTTSVPATFAFQTTDPATNIVTGTANTPFTLPAQHLQSLLLTFTPQLPIAPTDVAFSFTCANAMPASTTTGLNTFLLSASTTPTPDVIALAATFTSDGIVNIPGNTGTGAFAVASANVGVAGSFIVSANDGTANLPINITICQTDPLTAQCLAVPNANVATMIAAGGTPTFSIFVKGNGTVPLQAASNRIFVQFTDASGAIRGATSVAVRTQ